MKLVLGYCSALLRLMGERWVAFHSNQELVIYFLYIMCWSNWFGQFYIPYEDCIQQGVLHTCRDSNKNGGAQKKYRIRCHSSIQTASKWVTVNQVLSKCVFSFVVNEKNYYSSIPKSMAIFCAQYNNSSAFGGVFSYWYSAMYNSYPTKWFHPAKR